MVCLVTSCFYDSLMWIFSLPWFIADFLFFNKSMKKMYISLLTEGLVDELFSSDLLRMVSLSRHRKTFETSSTQRAATGWRGKETWKTKMKKQRDERKKRGAKCYWGYEGYRSQMYTEDKDAAHTLEMAVMMLQWRLLSQIATRGQFALYSCISATPTLCFV